MNTVARVVPYAVVVAVCAVSAFVLNLGLIGIAVTLGVLVGVCISLYAADHWELDSWLRSTPGEHLKHIALSVPLAALLAVLFVPIGALVGFVLGLFVRSVMRVNGYDV